MEKVMLSKEEAQALESALEISGGVPSNVVQWHSQDLWEGERSVLNDLDIDTVCRALYVGYEVEPGPEEKLLKHFQDQGVFKKKYPATEYHSGHMDGIRLTLDLLNIQIKGINC
ncbi:hypothetical protein [Neobacillus niacini]|uniref:hypothetical protein n=1 Tax=Neobacillus niacini TaxID=86668 RepID=UPI0021CB70A5|nr:hypothetical protein [Neobacillus niacini]MCM3763481.1 hypothetical protein [Neobacillus niacini]